MKKNLNNMSYFKKHKTIMYIIGGIVIISAIVIPRVFSNKASSDSSKEYKPFVSIVSVDSYDGNIKQIDTDATVQSSGQFEFRAQVSSPVEKVYVGIGDTVKAGQTILTLKNDDVYAQVSQAKANLDSAEAHLAEIKNGTRGEEMAIYEQQYKNAERDIKNSSRDTYGKIEDAIRNKSDFLFRNGESVNPEIIVRTENSEVERSINAKRLMLSEKMSAWKTLNMKDDTFSSSDDNFVSGVTSYAKAYFDSLVGIVNDLSTANSSLTQTTIDTYRSTVSGAQIQINTALGLYSNYLSAWRIAGDNLNLRKAGATKEQISREEAVVSQARAALSGARAQYAKTVIVSPIDGVVSALPYRVGDLTVIGSLITSVVNKSALELKGYISVEDSQYVKEGDKVTIDNKYGGVISGISPSADSKTKKVEIKVSVNDKDAFLVVGSTSHIRIISNIKKDDSTVGLEKEYLLPISAVNISNSGSFIYGVGQDSSKAIAYPVEIGEVVGELVRVKKGIKSGMEIIMPTIGLKDGQEVRINK